MHEGRLSLFQDNETDLSATDLKWYQVLKTVKRNPKTHLTSTTYKVLVISRRQKRLIYYVSGASR